MKQTHPPGCLAALGWLLAWLPRRVRALLFSRDAVMTSGHRIGAHYCADCGHWASCLWHPDARAWRCGACDARRVWQ